MNMITHNTKSIKFKTKLIQNLFQSKQENLATFETSQAKLSVVTTTSKMIRIFRQKLTWFSMLLNKELTEDYLNVAIARLEYCALVEGELKLEQLWLVFALLGVLMLIPQIELNLIFPKCVPIIMKLIMGVMLLGDRFWM